MKILGIETSCDETSIAVLEIKNRKLKVLSNVVSSQVKIHAPFGGVVPSLAAREHEKNLPRVLNLALRKAKIKTAEKEIDFIAVTQGPGLEPALWRGINFAKELARLWNKPLIGVNHLEGHIYSNWLPSNKKTYNLKSRFRKAESRILDSEISESGLITYNKIFPALNLIVSGGHTQLVLMTGHGKFKLIGETLDDAAGEAFDKVSKMLDLGYPGGPVVAQRAAKLKMRSVPIEDQGSSISQREIGKKVKIRFPRPMINSKNYNFSFSGLKTAVLYKIKELKEHKKKLTNLETNYICKEFQDAVIEVLVTKTIRAVKEFKVSPHTKRVYATKSQNKTDTRYGVGVKSVFLSGGVSANKLLRKTLGRESKKLKIHYSQPELEYTTDNAAMIALAGYYKFRSKKLEVRIKKSEKIIANPNLRIKNW